MFLLSFKNGDDDPTRNCLPLVEDFNSVSKNKEEAYEKFVKMSRNGVTYNKKLVSYHQNYYKLIGMDLSRLETTNIPQQINFTKKSE